MGLVLLWYIGAIGLRLTIEQSVLGSDGHAYWAAWANGPLYEGSALYTGTYVYPPPFAQLLWPATLLPWPVFRLLGLVAAVAAYLWLFRPLSGPFRIAALFAVSSAILVGNIEWLLALVLVLGFRVPGLWALSALTKATTAIPALWFVARREWRAVGIATAVGIAVVAVSFVLDPGAWLRWIPFALDATSIPGNAWFVNRILPLWPRLAAAVVVTVWAARTDRRWLLAVALVLAQPDWNPPTFALLAAIPRLRR